MAFTDTQVQALAGKLSAKHVRTRQANGRTLSYIEGWHAIAEVNRIFGFDAWDRQKEPRPTRDPPVAAPRSTAARPPPNWPSWLAWPSCWFRF